MQAPDIRFEFEPQGGGSVTIRTIRAEDARIEQAFVQRLSPRSKRLRFMSAVRELTPAALDRFVNVHFPDEMALIATVLEDGAEREIGVARYAHSSGIGTAEFAVVVSDDWQGRGVGSELLRCLFDVASSAGLPGIHGLILRENAGMLQLARQLGFSIEPCAEDTGLYCVNKDFER